MKRVNLLRSLVVQEWLGDNSHEYASFLTNTEQSLFEDMAKNFLESGFFDYELGNSVPLALCNVVKCPIVLFTSVIDCPILPLVPQIEILSTILIHAAYIRSGSGHYDAVASCNNGQKDSFCNSEKMQTENEHLPDKHLTACSCGRGHSTNKNKISCKEFKSRCKCYQNLKGCCEKCRCINCENPYGTREYTGSNQGGVQRKRRKNDKTPKTSMEYMQQKEQALPQEVWSNYECFVLQQILHLPSFQAEEVDYDLIYEIYICICKTVPENFPKDIRTKKYISAKVDGLLLQSKLFNNFLG